VSSSLSAGYGGWITTYGVLVTTRFGWTASDVALVFAGFGLGTVVLGPWLSRQADRRGRRALASIGTMIVLLWGVLLTLGAPKGVVLATSIPAGGGLAVAQASWFALLAQATGGGRRAGWFGAATAVTSMGTVVGGFACSAAWQTFGVQTAVGLAVLFVALSLVSLGLVKPPHAIPV
jgi:predicted MFS family arabinose efflux permease